MNENPNGDGDPIVFSSHFACHQCGYSLSELEPRLFSFNNPAGACPTCDGLGVRQFIDAKRVIPDGSLALSEGAIQGWDRRNVYYFHLLSAVAKHYGLIWRRPLIPSVRSTGTSSCRGRALRRLTSVTVRNAAALSAGSTPLRAWCRIWSAACRETDSNMVRENLARFMSVAPCDACGGTRLRREAQAVFLEGRTLPAITHDSIADAAAYLTAWPSKESGEKLPTRSSRKSGHDCAFWSTWD